MGEEKYIRNGATLRCSMGDQMSQLVVLPERRVIIEGSPMANIGDHKSMVNIKPFGKCRSLANPTVAAATAAHHGTLTPMPCVPNTPSNWLHGKTDVDVQGLNGLLQSSCLNCVWAGVIKVAKHGQTGSSESPKIAHETASCEISRVELCIGKGEKKKKMLVYDNGGAKRNTPEESGGSQFVVTEAEKIEHESYTCEITRVDLCIGKKGKMKSVRVYEKK